MTATSNPRTSTTPWAAVCSTSSRSCPECTAVMTSCRFRSASTSRELSESVKSCRSIRDPLVTSEVRTPSPLLAPDWRRPVRSAEGERTRPVGEGHPRPPADRAMREPSGPIRVRSRARTADVRIGGAAPVGTGGRHGRGRHVLTSARRVVVTRGAVLVLRAGPAQAGVLLGASSSLAALALRLLEEACGDIATAEAEGQREPEASAPMWRRRRSGRSRERSGAARGS